MDMSIITRAVLQPARTHADDLPALSLDDTTWTYRGLAQQANVYANGLLRLQAKPGDRIGVLLLNSLEYWALYLAITRIGAIAVRLNWRLTAEELDHAVDDSGTSILCTHDRFLSKIPSQGNDRLLRSVVVFPYDEPADSSRTGVAWQQAFDASEIDEPDIALPNLEDPCMLMYTSGTTGRPKGALWTHGNSLWFAVMQAMRWHYDDSTVALSTGPLFHVGSFEDHLLPTLVCGGHAIITRSGDSSYQRTIEMIAKNRVTDSLIYPFMIYELLSAGNLAGLNLESMRRVTTGGSPLLPWAVRRFEEVFPYVRLEQVYGLTEGGGISTVMPSKHLGRHPGSVGTPLPFTELRIARNDSPKADADYNEIGELWVRSPSVCCQYYGKPQETAETFVDGWCRTGDLARLTEDGFLYLTGRAKDMIISGGENIYPAELEAVLSDHSEIRDIAIIGVPDAKYQETVCAVIVREPGASIDAAAVVAYSCERLASYKKPSYVVFVDELPRNASGKLLKRALRQQYESLGTI